MIGLVLCELEGCYFVHTFVACVQFLLELLRTGSWSGNLGKQYHHEADMVRLAK
jgi:hypothetical protein